MPQLLTCRETPKSVAGRVAGFKSEWWPASRSEYWRLQSESAGILKGYPTPRDARSRVIVLSYLEGRCPAGYIVHSHSTGLNC
jgi:hypothetical protein